MESMWDRLFDCPIPMDRVARIVTSSAPWWAQPIDARCAEDGGAVRKKRTPISDYVSIMLPPPQGLLDYRGRRGRFNIIVGFAYRKIIRSKHSTNSRTALARRETFGRHFSKQVFAQATHANSVSVWYCLRADGEVITVTSKALRKKLSNLDISYLGDVRLGRTDGAISGEWMALDSIPINATPCAK